MNFTKHLHWVIYTIFLLAACAKQSSPTGGPKDTIPPVLVAANPKDEAISFSGTRVELEFNEMVIANNPKEQIIITPSIGKDFEVKARKNSIILEFEKQLEANTTYTFNFRESIQDITEKNPTKNLQLAVSTGDYIDSLSIAGVIYNLLTGKEIKDATVAIHTSNDTFSILKHPATFFTKTDEKGRFKIEHLKPDLYYIYAMEDKNRNLVADSRSESYGFRTDPILLKSDTGQLSLGLIRLDARPLKITSARPYNTFFNIRTSKNLRTFDLTTQDSSTLFFSYGEDPSNIKVYNTLQRNDSIAVHLVAFDSIENKIDTVIYAKFIDREVTPEKFTAAVKSSSIIADKGLLNITFEFNKPIKAVNFDSLFFQVDSINKITFAERDFMWDRKHNTLTISKSIDKKLFAPKPDPDPASKPPAPIAKPRRKGAQDDPPPAKQIFNELFAGKSAFISVENDSSQKMIESITPFKTENLSMIIYDIRTLHKNIIVQLIDKDRKVVRETAGKIKGQFEDLVAGEYMVRVIIDRNNNGKWDPGNYLQRLEPEPIIYYLGEKGAMNINLKSNWEFQMAPMLINF